jgi:hypothetical protein
VAILERGRFICVFTWALVPTLAISAESADLVFVGGSGFSVGEDPRGIVAADFDGDGDTDIATANMASRSVIVLKNDGDALFLEARDFPVGERVARLIAAKLDDNDSIDLAGATGSSLVLLFNDGDGGFSESVPR